jgi:hypothetical protein
MRKYKWEGTGKNCIVLNEMRSVTMSVPGGTLFIKKLLYM